MLIWKNGGKISHPQATFEVQPSNEHTSDPCVHNLCINKGHAVPLKVNDEELEWIPRKRKKDREKDVNPALKDHILEEVDRQALHRPHHNVVRSSEQKSFTSVKTFIDFIHPIKPISSPNACALFKHPSRVAFEICLWF